MDPIFDDGGKMYVWKRACPCGCGRMDAYKGTMVGYIDYVAMYPGTVTPGRLRIKVSFPKSGIKNFLLNAN